MNLPIDYQSLFQSLPEHYVVFAPDSPIYTMVAASDEYLKLTGKTTREVIGKSLFGVFPDTSERAIETGVGELQESLDTVLKTKKPDSTGVIRYDLADKKGVLQVRYWQATHYPLFEGKKLIGIIQSTADVTTLVKSNEELKLANIKLEEAKAAGMVGSWTWDIEQDIVRADKGLAQLFGVPVEDAIQGLPIQIFIDSIHKNDREVVSEKIQNALESGSKFEAEYRTVDTNNETHWVIARGRVERNEKGEAIALPGVMIDISSRKKAEAELIKSEERLRFMADTMPQLVWITRPDGYHEYYNKHWYEYTGTNEGDTDGVGWNNLFHKSDQARARKVWRNALESGEPYEIKYRLYHAPSKTYRWVIGRALPFKDENGEILKWYGTCTDIDDSMREIEMRIQLEKQLKEERDSLESRVAERTSQLQLTNEGLRSEIKKRMEAEEKLRKNTAELARSNKELEEFAYVSSHDLQEPLRKIQAFGDLLVEEYGKELGDGSEYLARIQGSAQRMSTLIQDLLTFSRVTTKPATTQPTDLNEIVQYAIADLHDRIKKEKGTVRVAPNLPIVLADKTHMQQLFQNLLSNALKFHPSDRAPVVEVFSEKKEGVDMIYIRDNGLGIDVKYQEKIFAVFQRLNTKQHFEGTGIGLAVCKKIIERYNGTISLESQSGKGTTFIITLPVGNEA